jgi:hypothetical protein
MHRMGSRQYAKSFFCIAPLPGRALGSAGLRARLTALLPTLHHGVRRPCFWVHVTLHCAQWRA